MPLIQSAQAQEIKTAVLSKYEQTVFGKTNSALSPEQRLQAIEVSVLGKAQKGQMDKRMARLHDLLTEPSIKDSKANSSIPPLAPSKDKLTGQVQQSYLNSAPPISNISPNASEVPVLLKQATHAFAGGNKSQAQKLFGDVLAIEPANTNANFSMGVIAEQNGDLRSALSYYKTVLATNPNDAEAKEATSAVQQKLQADSTNRNNFLQAHAQTNVTSAEQASNSTGLPNSKPMSGKKKAIIGACAAAAVGVALSTLRGGGGLDIGCPICRMIHLGL